MIMTLTIRIKDKNIGIENSASTIPNQIAGIRDIGEHGENTRCRGLPRVKRRMKNATADRRAQLSRYDES